MKCAISSTFRYRHTVIKQWRGLRVGGGLEREGKEKRRGESGEGEDKKKTKLEKQ